MKIFIDFLSIILFYVAYQVYENVPIKIIHFINSWLHVALIPGEKSNAIYFAILIGIVAAGLQTLFHWVIDGKPTKLHLITLFAFLLFGGITIFLRDPVFIKWKPTLVNAIFALIFLVSTMIGSMPLAQRMMGNFMHASKQVWHRLTISWAVFFLVIAILNIIVAYNFSESSWVNFKLFGILGLTIGFLMIQAFYISKNSQTKIKK